MSRVRFHSMDAVSKVSDLTYSGRGWKNYDNEKSVQENIDRIYEGDGPDVVVVYKPLILKGFSDIKALKCIRYNEMWDIKGTKKEIQGGSADIVVCHHKNDMKTYVKMKELKDVKFVNISHCTEKTIYKDYGLPKEYDVLFTGAVSRHYPFRARLLGLCQNQLNKKFNCKILPHPGDRGIPYQQIGGFILDKYAKEINKAKITLTCSSQYKYRLEKYVQIPACGSLLAADLPDEDQDFFRKFMLVLNPSDSDSEIIDKIAAHIDNDKKRKKLTKRGIEMNQSYTQEDYARRLINEFEIALEEKQ